MERRKLQQGAIGKWIQTGIRRAKLFGLDLQQGADGGGDRNTGNRPLQGLSDEELHAMINTLSVAVGVNVITRELAKEQPPRRHGRGLRAHGRGSASAKPPQRSAIQRHSPWPRGRGHHSRSEQTVGSKSAIRPEKWGVPGRHEGVGPSRVNGPSHGADGRFLPGNITRVDGPFRPIGSGCRRSDC